MITMARTCRLLAAFVAAIFLSGCVAGPAGNYYSVNEPDYPAGPSLLAVGQMDRTFVLRIDDRTPFGLWHLPMSRSTLYQKGYDLVGRDREADFELDVSFFATARDNPEQRAGNTLGGALLGAATGALIGGALGSPARGAAIGAGSGAFLGLVAPAGATVVQIDIRTRSFRDGTTSYKTALIDLAHVPQYDVQRVVDMQVSRLLETLPSK